MLVFRFGDEDIRNAPTVNMFLLKLTHFFAIGTLISFLTTWFFYGWGGRGAPPYPPHEKKNPLSGIFLDLYVKLQFAYFDHLQTCS